MTMDQRPATSGSAAVADYSKAIELQPDDALTYYDRGLAYMVFDDLKQAIRDFEKYLELAPDAPDREEVKNQIEELKSKSSNPSNTPTVDYLQQGITNFEAGNYEQAIADYTKAIELNPEKAEAYLDRGYAYEQLGDYEQSIADYDRAIALDPQNAPAYYNRGVVFGKQANSQQAVANFTKAIELNYDPLSWAYNDRGLIYRGLGDDDKALADFNTALELDPDYAGAYYNRANFYASHGDDEQAIADYSQALESNPSLVRAYMSRGSAYGRLGSYEQAVADYTKATDLDPNNADAFNNLAWTLAVDLGTDYQTALKHAQRAVELDPSGATHDTLAMIYYKLEQYEQALEHYDLALSLDDENFYSYKGRGDVYLALDNQEAALADYEAYLSQAPAGPERDEVEAIVKSLQAP
jgi:tetratricopeptide (TPR) repeat protein